MTRLLPLLAATCAAALLAAGCTSDKPSPNYSSITPTPSTSTSPTTSTAAPNTTANVPSGAVSPSEPSAARQNTSDAAFAFVAYYWKQVDWAYSTVNGDVLQGLYRSTCQSCESSRSAINAVRDKDHLFRGGHLTITSQALAPVEADPTASFAIDTVLTVEALTELATDGAQVASYPASTYTVRAFVTWASDHFEVTATANVGG